MSKNTDSAADKQDMENAASGDVSSDSPELTSEEQLAKAQAEAEEFRDKWIRVQAELDNYRKRAQRDREDYIKYSAEGVVRDFLPVMDNLERVILAARADHNVDSMIQGVELTFKQFIGLMETRGMKPIETDGKLFDPKYHDAIQIVELERNPENEAKDGMIATVIERGYLCHERILRPSRVMVYKLAKNKPQPQQGPEEGDNSPKTEVD